MNPAGDNNNRKIMIKKRLLSNSRDPEFANPHALDSYKDMPVTSEEEEAWMLLAAKETLDAIEKEEREAKKVKSFPGRFILPSDPLDSSD